MIHEEWWNSLEIEKRWELSRHNTKVGWDAAKSDEAEKAEQLRMALGLLTTLHPTMEIDVTNPVGMAQQIVVHVNRQIKHWKDARQSALDGGDILKAEVERLRAEVSSLESSPLSEETLDILRSEIKSLKALLREVLLYETLTSGNLPQRIRAVLFAAGVL